jgi:hypothetical protein
MLSNNDPFRIRNFSANGCDWNARRSVNKWQLTKRQIRKSLQRMCSETEGRGDRRFREAYYCKTSFKLLSKPCQNNMIKLAN